LFQDDRWHLPASTLPAIFLAPAVDAKEFLEGLFAFRGILRQRQALRQADNAVLQYAGQAARIILEGIVLTPDLFVDNGVDQHCIGSILVLDVGFGHSDQLGEDMGRFTDRPGAIVTFTTPKSIGGVLADEFWFQGSVGDDAANDGKIQQAFQVGIARQHHLDEGDQLIPAAVFQGGFLFRYLCKGFWFE
jgi:hypothetical protein